MPHQITPLTDPALDALAQFVAEGLNSLHAGMVRRWIASEVPSFRIEEYPLLQVQCLSREGEFLDHCQGSIRYLLPNDQLRVGSEQQTTLPYVAQALAKQLRKFEEGNLPCDSPIQLLSLHTLRSETRTGPLTLVDGGQVQLTWCEVFFRYSDHTQI